MAEGTDSDRTEVIGAPVPEPAASRLHQNALPVGTRLGEFEIIDLVGEGGFGIVYLAQDHSLHRKVALKEYMPALLASRGEDCSVSVRSERQRETFDIGLRSFVNEARMLAQFDHAALVKVYRFWEAHGTAYMVMPFFSGQTLQDALKERAEPPDEAWIKALLMPLMEALAILHADQVYHRDIAPDNIMLLGDGRPVLLDFGAARRVISDMTHALTVILKPGYAPIEQYADMPGMKQGPWTDVYALAAVVYFMIRKRKPPPSVGRLMEDDYEPLAGSEAAGRYSEQLLRGIDKCLSVRAPDRPQNMAAMSEAVGFAAMPTVIIPPAPDKPAGKTEPSFTVPGAVAEAPPEEVDIQLPESPEEPPAAPGPRSKAPLVVASVVVLSLLAGGIAYLARRPAPVAPVAAAPVAATPAPKTPASAAVAVPAPPPAPRIAGLGAAVDAALAAADPRLSIALEAPASVAVGNDLKLVARSRSDGLLYLFAWDQGSDRIYRLAPGEKDGGAAIKADAAFAVTHKDPAAAAAKPGSWRVVAMLAEKPRDFSGSAFVREGDALVAERAALEARLAASGLAGLFGAVQCAPGETCADRFAIAVANVAREAAPPPTARRAPAPAPANPGKKNADSEREYMKRFNKDLDNLLGK